MKITEDLIEQILEQSENGGLDPSPYMENLKFLLLEDEEIEMTEQDQAYLIFLGTLCLESLHRVDLYKDIHDEEMFYDMEDVNWEALEEADGNLDVFLSEISQEFVEKDLLDFIAFSILPANDDEDGDAVMSSEDAQMLGFIRVKAMVDAVLMPVL